MKEVQQKESNAFLLKKFNSFVLDLPKDFHIIKIYDILYQTITFQTNIVNDVLLYQNNPYDLLFEYTLKVNLNFLFNFFNYEIKYSLKFNFAFKI